MTQSTTGKIAGVLLGGLAATGIFAAFGSAPAAQASCISAFGINSSVNCTSTFTSLAIAIGTDATAFAPGALSVAFTVGDDSGARTYGGGSIAVNVGQGSLAVAGAKNSEVLNVAVQLGGKIATVAAVGGSLNAAINVAGRAYSGVYADGGFGNVAISAFNTNTAVLVGPGPLAVAVGIAQNNSSFTTIVKQKPGININGFRLPNTAASTPPGLATRRSTGNPAAAATPKAARPSAAARSRRD